MTGRFQKYILTIALTVLTAGAVWGQNIAPAVSDSLKSARLDSLYNSITDSAAWEKELEFARELNLGQEPRLQLEETSGEMSGTQSTARPKRLSWKQQDSIEVARFEFEAEEWVPNPRKATFLALLFPGGGQIYNRKYWKLPIVYGGFVGCVYALTWNQGTYTDYRNAYVDIMDSDPETKSYEDFLPPHYEIDTSMEDWLKDVFKNRKDKYRRYRDLSIFAFAGMYVLSAIDAYVDAELSHFDISPNLSMQWSPSLLPDRNGNPGAAFTLALNF